MIAKSRRFVVVLLVASACAALLCAVARRGGAVVETTTVIVELRQEPAAVQAARARRQGRALPDAELQAYREQVRAGQDRFLASLAQRGVSASVMTRAVKGYDGSTAAAVDLRYTLVYNGLALRVPRESIDMLRAMPEVKSVKANGLLYTALAKSVGYIGAPRVYGAVAELTQFDDLREGFEGQGINLAVLDTGIDWTHPMFGGDPTPPRLGVAPAAAGVNTNQKVIYNLPLTDIAANDGFGHGTHVAATAAGYLAEHPGSDGLPLTGDEVRLHGVAPQAKLMSYTVCSNIRSVPGSLGLPSIGGCESADIIMALEDSVSPFTLTGFPKPVAHVINLSLGGGGGPDNPTAVACSNAALTGATVVAASGNSGPGEGTTGSPAAGTHVISVGATTHPGGGSQWSADQLQAAAFPATRTGAVTPANTFQAAAGTPRLTLFPMAGTAGLPAASMAQRYTFVNLPLGQWPASVAGRIALVKDALGATIFDIVAQAQNAGAVGVILFDDRGAVNGVRTLIPAATISPADGEVLVDALSSTDDNSVDPPNGAVSERPVRMNPFLTEQFMGEMGGFSSRGPVQGLGQVKPDVSAPGVAVLAAVPPASVLAAIGTLEGTPNYAHLDGTSMASPHTAGAAALVKQAHPNWTPDMIRTALINTATNMRDQRAAPKADGPSTADSIIAQGGGLIEVGEALHAKALMGVAGDGVSTPGILGSHSFGEVPVINSRTTHTETVTVTVRDLSGQGGTYNLGVANNRDLQLAGINVALSQPSVSVPAGGEATFDVRATVDGDLLRDVMAAKTVGTSVLFERIQMQWFVTAGRADGGESLRMPFFFRPGRSMPANPVVETKTETALVPAGDAGAQRDNLGFQPELSGVTYAEIPFEVDASTIRVEALTEWFELPAGDQPDLDYELVGPDGQVIVSAGAAGGPEYVSHFVTQTGTYKHRVIGFANAATEVTVTTTLTKGSPPPAAQPIAGEFADAQGRQIDYDGAFTVSWQGRGGETGFEVERSSDGGQSWRTVASLGGDATSLPITRHPNGTHQFRVRGLTPGRVGNYVTPPSAPQSVTIDRRILVDITATTQGAVVPLTYSFDGSATQLEWTLTNRAGVAYHPRVEMRIVRINSAGGVAVANADDGGDGLGPATAALFDYTDRLGSEQEFAPGEKSGSRLIRFRDPTGQLFTFDMVVTAYERQGGAAAAGDGGGASGGEASAGSSGGAGALALPVKRYVRVTVNPLTRGVTAQLINGVL